jgi:PAS domain S-box-containing protein
MKLVKWQKFIIIAISVGILIFLSSKSQLIDFKQHDRFTSNLLRIKELDAVLNQDVVKARAGLLTYYDPLANNLADLKQHQEKLKIIPSFIDSKGQNKIKRILAEQKQVCTEKENLIERFKSENSLLNNSLYYFPTLIDELSQKARNIGSDRLENNLESLLRNILIYNLNSDKEITTEIQKNINSLSRIKNQENLQLYSNEIDKAIFHGQTILANKPKVNALIKELISLPTSYHTEELYKVYNNSYEKALKSVSLYRLLLALFCMILIGGISTSIILRLRKSAQIVNAAKEKLQEALEATRQAEEKFRKIYENSTDGIFQTTPDGQYLSANPTLANIYGYSSPEELIANITDIAAQLYVNPNRRDEFIAAVQTHEVVSQFESQVYRKDGSITWISENARAVKDAKGKLLYYEGTVEDIAERKQTDAMLQASETKLRMQQTALMELSKCQPLYTGELSAALQEITETAAYTLGVERVSTWFYNQERSQLHCVDLYELGPNRHSEGLELRRVDYPGYFQALEAERAIAADDAHTDSRTCEFSVPYLAPLGISSMLDVPIRLGGRTVGVLCHEQTGNARKWSLEEENFASYLAYMASLAMEARDRKQAQEALRLEREKAERLLLNILPEPIAQRLKQEQGSIADSFEEVSVLFADIVGFTQIASSISPTELVDLLNQIFSTFDHLADRHGLEKIKTIGDAYMVVAGLPIPRIDHAHAIAEMALDMQQAVTKFSDTTGAALNIRIGINTGPVVAGVIGIRKFIYDLWGDTVNIASRMESQGIPGCIQVTGVTYELLKEKYLFEHRGIIQVKGKGEMTTYFLTHRKGIGNR